MSQTAPLTIAERKTFSSKREAIRKINSQLCQAHADALENLILKGRLFNEMGSKISAANNVVMKDLYRLKLVRNPLGTPYVTDLGRSVLGFRGVFPE